MTATEALERAKQLRWDCLRSGKEPTTIVMNQRTYDKIVGYSRELVAIDAGDHPEYTLYGMKVEVRNNIDDETMFLECLID